MDELARMDWTGLDWTRSIRPELEFNQHPKSIIGSDGSELELMWPDRFMYFFFVLFCSKRNG